MFNRKVSSLVSFVVLLLLLLLSIDHSLPSSVVVAKPTSEFPFFNRDASPTRHRLIAAHGSTSNPLVPHAVSDAVGKRRPSP
ncbi:hypothetical protein RHGRI_010630 [Rhododendron griersonianum]|uniref:Uncharacterized protein n=1 Tax=Rhododendron griersonianum TaxID=479676 RepID=A0AAV6KJ76_9ERIC|nr:hypothetical protein RHGRI_010630 [Rhododendron griersonianum]